MKNSQKEGNKDQMRKKNSQTNLDQQENEKSSSTSSDFLQKAQKYEVKLQNKKIYQAPKLNINSDIYKRRMKKSPNEETVSSQYRYPAPNKTSKYNEFSPQEFVKKIKSAKKILPENETPTKSSAFDNIKDKVNKI